MLKPYKSYKETNISWCEKIPNDWDWLLLSQVCKEHKTKNVNSKESNVLSLSYGNIIRKRNIDSGLVPKEYNSYHIVSSGNIILRLTDLQNDHKSLRTGLVNEKGIITSAYTCLKPINSGAYLQMLLHSFDTLKVFYGMGGGVRQSIGYTDIRNMRVPTPPIEEQDQIVKYLDWQTSKINKLINGKKKQIELLKEQKQAIINQAVTKGLDANAEMKDSGVAWLSEIPKHWDVRRLGKLTTLIKTGGTPNGVDEKYYKENGFPWFTPGDFMDSLYINNSKRSLSNIGKNSVSVFPKGSVLMIGIGGTLGKVCISETECSCNQQINVIICNKILLNTYLLFFLRAQKNHIFNMAQFTTLPILNQEQTGLIPLILMSLAEQQEIVDYITETTTKIDQIISKAQSEIELVLEYKTRLISDVVTGQVDVRNVLIPEFVSEEVTPDLEEENIIDNDEEEGNEC